MLADLCIDMFDGFALVNVPTSGIDQTTNTASFFSLLCSVAATCGRGSNGRIQFVLSGCHSDSRCVQEDVLVVV